MAKRKKRRERLEDEQEGAQGASGGEVADEAMEEAVAGVLGDAGAMEGPVSRKHRPTREGMKERIGFCVMMMQRRMYTSDIKRAMKREFPGMSTQTALRYMTRARKLLPKRYAELGIDPKRDSILFWDSLVRGNDIDMRTKTLAQDKLDERFGVHRPKDEDEFSDSRGQHPGVMEVIVSTRAEAKQVIELAKQGRTIDIANLKSMDAVDVPVSPAETTKKTENVEVSAMSVDPLANIVETVVTRADLEAKPRLNGFATLPEVDDDGPPKIVPD